MIDETSNFNGGNNTFEANGPGTEANASGTMNKGDEKLKGKVKEYGKKSLGPLINLMHKYKDEIDPYFTSISKGLDGAVKAFDGSPGLDSGSEKENTKADESVARWFREGSEWFSRARSKFQNSDAKELMHFLEEETRKHPALMFSSSYVAGMAFGRLGRHFGRILTKDEEPSSVSENFQSASRERFGDGTDRLRH